MRSFQQHLSEFNARGIRLAAISSDEPEVTLRHCRKLGFTFTFLCDPKFEAIRRYDLLHPGGGPSHTDIARPAEFLIDSAGIVRWIFLTDAITVRARPDQVLKAAEDLK